MEQQNDELVLVAQQNNEVVPVEEKNDKLVSLPQHINELVPDEQQNNEIARVAYQKCELLPVAQQNSELVPVEQSQPNYEAQPNRRRKKSSIVWEHFTIEYVGAGCRRAYCKQCKQSFAYSTGSKVAGTSHLKRHIAKGACPLVLRNQQNGPSTPLSAPSKMGAYGDTPKRRFRTPHSPYFSFDPDHCRHEIARMILMHDYPLHMVEHSGFVSFARSLQPRFDMVSFNTVQGDCVSTYLKEKQKLQEIIETMPGRICLTLDMWSSSRTVGYVVLTGHFIDSDWKLQSKILSVIMEPYPESDTAFSHAVAACLSDWNLEGKVFSITINQPLNDPSIDNLRALLSVKNPLVLSGQLLIGNCLARSLSNIAQDAFTSVSGTIKKIRDSVKYVKTSESLEDKFLQLKQQLQIPSSKVLALDDQTRWNTTYDMLSAAAELKEVFSCLDTSDYKDFPSMEDWKQVETLCAYLSPLFDTANILTSPSFPTTNTFFHEAWKIQLELARAAANGDSFVSNLTKPMQEKFDNYWKSCCFILAFAVVMDPRFKMKLVQFSFQKIYGEEKAAEYVKVVDEGIHELFLEYASLPSDLMEIDGVNTGTVKPEDHRGGDTAVANGPGLIDFDMYIKQTNSQHPKSELDQYLEESLLPRFHEFDVVGWWRLNKEKYPILSKMARDVLYVPVCSVSHESVFDTVKKEMDPYRCSLRPETIEALICAKDWIQSRTEDDSNAIVKLEVPI
ncbi:hypothetical protein Leryth_001350 [Lithospermum erythrorhizon]|nr:hypothetical protein Leryth_001350 [Lithospermum erythrorhizon]